MKKEKAEAPKKQESPKIPKAISLWLRMIVAEPKPDKDGRWLFKASLPTLGTPALDIRARTSKGALRVLERLVKNGLDERDDVWTAGDGDDKEPR